MNSVFQSHRPGFHPLDGFDFVLTDSNIYAHISDNTYHEIKDGRFC